MSTNYILKKNFLGKSWESLEERSLVIGYLKDLSENKITVVETDIFAAIIYADNRELFVKVGAGSPRPQTSDNEHLTTNIMRSGSGFRPHNGDLQKNRDGI
jgi:hypothetical protein